MNPQASERSLKTRTCSRMAGDMATRIIKVSISVRTFCSPAVQGRGSTIDCGQHQALNKFHTFDKLDNNGIKSRGNAKRNSFRDIGPDENISHMVYFSTMSWGQECRAISLHEILSWMKTEKNNSCLTSYMTQGPFRTFPKRRRSLSIIGTSSYFLPP